MVNSTIDTKYMNFKKNILLSYSVFSIGLISFLLFFIGIGVGYWFKNTSMLHVFLILSAILSISGFILAKIPSKFHRNNRVIYIIGYVLNITVLVLIITLLFVLPLIVSLLFHLFET